MVFIIAHIVFFMKASGRNFYLGPTPVRGWLTREKFYFYELHELLYMF